ncbi:mucin-17-like [Eriocheir sinensis]|uniref:mucin-17-like n=1 Tax=Eriocheir sinensis TaxID=95602 RepID=UPI0021C7E83A|nr:mucin-17-like [Eriocheir sinensis]
MSRFEVKEVSEEDGCDELGFRLEDELNRSIGKMREEEASGLSSASPPSAQEEEPEKEVINVHVEKLISLSDSTCSSEGPSANATPKPCSSSSPVSPAELLQDVEMPIWDTEASKLSSASPATPHHANMATSQQTGASQQAQRGSTTQSHPQTAILVATSPFSSDDTNLSDSVFEKEQHKGSSPHSFFELLQDCEMPSCNMSSCELSRLLSFPSTSPSSASSKHGTETLSSSAIMSEAISVLAELERATANMTSSPDSPGRRMTVHPLDMEGINDSLLSSPFRHPSQNLVPQDLSLPSSSKREGNTEPQSSNTAMKENTIVMTEPVGVKSELSTVADKDSLASKTTTKGCLESENYASTETDQTPSSSEQPVIEEEAAVSLTNDLKKSPSETNIVVNTTFDFKMSLGKENAAANTTFDFKQPTKKENPSVDSTFVMLGKENPAANTTFDCKKVSEKENPVVNTTFDSNRPPAEWANQQVNTTFDCKRPATGENQAANSTFNTDNRPTGVEAHQAAVNTTFDYNQDRNEVNSTFTTTQKQNSEPSSSSHNKTNELNVTFEKGEYRIGDQNETVNLMDVEENVLQVILDATPKKVCRQVPKAASTPKTSGHHTKPHLKAGLTKASPMNILHRLLEGTKQEAHQELPSTSATTTTALPSLPTSLKFGNGQQQRRQNGSGVVRPGPMKALPLSTLVTNAAHLQEQFKSAATGSGDEHSGGSTSSMKGTLAQRRRGIAIPSFGSISSIENDDMSGTPDGVINHNTSISSPETFRMDVLSCRPRITSTPTFGSHRIFPDVMEMDGAIPTPISQVSSRPRFSELISSSCPGSSNGSLEKEEVTKKSSSDGSTDKNLPEQPSPADTEVPQPSQSSSTHPLPTSTLQPSSAEPIFPSNSQQHAVEPVLPSTVQLPSSRLSQSSSLHPPQSSGLSSSWPSQSASCLPSRLSTSQPPQPSTPSPPEQLQVEDDTTKNSKECEEQKLDICEKKLGAAPTSVPQITQAPVPQTVLNVTVTTEQQSVPSVIEIQPPAPLSPSAQPSSLLPSPPGTTTLGSTTGSVTVMQSSSSLLPPPTTNTTVQPSSSPSSPHATTRKPKMAVNNKVSQTKSKKSTLALPSSTKTAMSTGGRAGAEKDGKLKRQSNVQKPLNTRGKQAQPMSNSVDKENRRKSGTVVNKQTPSSPSQKGTEGQPPQRVPLTKRNPSPRLILKPSNTNIKETINKHKFTNRPLTTKDAPMKAVPQIGIVGTVKAVKSIPEVQIDEAGSTKGKGVVRKQSPEPHRGLSRTLSGSKLPRNESAPGTTKPPQKTLSNHSKKLRSPLKRSEAEVVSRSKLPNTSGRTIPVTHSSKNPSAAPQIKANLPVRSGEALRRKPSLLKTPKPVV